MPNFTNARKAEMVSMLMPTFDEDEALTLEQLEQKTGFTYCRRLGEEFLSGELSLEQINNQIESLERSLRYGDSKGSIYGLAHAFGITLEGKSYEELLNEIKEFIKNKAFERLTPEEKIEALASGKADFSSMTRLVWECERHEFVRLLGLDVEAIYQENREQHLAPTDKMYLEECICRAIRELKTEETKPEKILTYSQVKLSPEEEYKKAQYDHYLADKDYDKASNEYFGLQSEVNLLRSEWLSLVTAIKGFSGKRLHGLKLLEQEIREKYFEVRLKSLRALKARREQAQEVDRASARMKEAGKKFVEEPISKAI